MNITITGLLKDFKAAQHSEDSISESQLFEHFAAHLVIGSIAENTSITSHTVVGENGQIAVDVIGIIVNGNLIENEDEIDTFISANSYLDVDFVFAQVKTSENFELSALSSLGEFANDFIEEKTDATDTPKVADIRKIKNKIYNESKYFKRRNPSVYIYYVTTGAKPTDTHFSKKIEKIKAEFAAKSNTSDCRIELVGAKEIQALKRQLDNSLEKEIVFSRRVSLPQTTGIDEAYLGVVPASTLISLLEGHSGNMLSSIFYDNVRDWQGENTVNSGIAKTLAGKTSRSRFVFMNNGITVIAKKIRTTGDKILLENYQIVNGCQTSNVLWNSKQYLDETVLIPLKIVATTNEEVLIDIIRATNSQTEITASQLLAATDFQKQLEQYFQVEPTFALHYERRSKQFANSFVDRASIVTPINLMKAYASIVLEEPHKTTRDFKSVIDRGGKSIFGAKHKVELYYMVALAQYWIDQLLRKGMIDRSLISARFQILLAFKIFNQLEGMPPVESNKAKKWANDLTKKLKNISMAQKHFQPAIELISSLMKAKTNKRDAARNVTFTEEVISAAKNKIASAKKTAGKA